MADRSTGADPATRAAIVAEARAWVGTPYVHQASCRGAGADCLGLVRGVWRAVLGPEPETPPPYTPGWAETGGPETLWRAAARHLRPLDPAAATAGDLLLFRMRAGCPAKHLGILVTPGIPGGRIVHAYSGAAVAETHLSAPWARRIAAAFRFPERRP